MAAQFPMVSAGRSILRGAIVKVPKSDKCRLTAGEILEHSVADLLLRAGYLPNADLIHLPVKVLVHPVRPIRFAKIVVFAALEGRKAGGRGVGPDERPIEIKPHAAFSGNSSDMAPLIKLQES